MYGMLRIMIIYELFEVFIDHISQNYIEYINYIYADNLFYWTTQSTLVIDKRSVVTCSSSLASRWGYLDDSDIVVIFPIRVNITTEHEFLSREIIIVKQ